VQSAFYYTFLSTLHFQSHASTELFFIKLVTTRNKSLITIVQLYCIFRFSNNKSK